MSVPPTQIYPYKNQIYEQLRTQYDSKNLFNDCEFPPIDQSLYYTKSPPRNIRWKRPHEICSNPQFIVDDASRFDLDQGYLGNCWFIAAVSTITQRPLIFQHVIPSDQSFNFNENYNGLFHFRFWQFGKWYDVVVDDLLPVFPDGRLVFCSNKTQKNEFWSCLLEKAYAKLSWSYEGLEAGQTSDALIDMTGGIEESYELKEVERGTFFDTLGYALAHDAMMGCSIHADPSEREVKLPSGLIMGHAYAITAVVTLNVNGRTVKLVRVRNPWGNEVEWNGAWSDRDPVWNQLPYQDRQNLGQQSRADGEFWMTYEDWIENFHQIQICSVSPDTLKSSRSGPDGYQWNCLQFDGEWVNGVSAGGSGKGRNSKVFWQNPQYLVRLPYADPGHNDCVLIAACLQKYTRQKRMQVNGRSAEEYIQLRLYRVNDGVDVSIYQSGVGEKIYPKDLERIGTSGAYINKREVTYQCRVPPGNYIIIPSTYDANKEAKFLLRLYTESPADSISMNVDRPDIGPHEFEFRDGQGEDRDFGIMQWYDSLPPHEKEQIIGYAVAGTTAAICCCFQIISEMLKNNEEDEYAKK